MVVLREMFVYTFLFIVFEARFLAMEQPGFSISEWLGIEGKKILCGK